MRIERLGPQHLESYAAFRRTMWPTHDSAGQWEVAAEKYILNPHARLCPGTGLYACIEEGQIQGIAGAYPMPITYHRELHPGHMLVDWAVLPSTDPEDSAAGWRRKLYASKLFAFVMALPGLKFASYGTSSSQAALQRRSVRIPACKAAALIKPGQAVLLELLRLRRNAQPCPLAAMPMELPGMARSISPDDLPDNTPANLENTAHVWRGTEFWREYFKHRIHNGAYALKVESGRDFGYAILNLLQVGRFRFANLLSMHLLNATPEVARHLGATARHAFEELGVSFVLATDSDSVVHSFLNSLAVYVHRSPTHWWRVPQAGDSLPVYDVPWHLTSADRDAIWWPGQQTPEVQDGHLTTSESEVSLERNVTSARQ